jgi:hypothetical protein
MRRKLLLLAALLLSNAIISPAQADVYVIVDSNNVVVSGAIVCDAGVCGNPNSLYSKLTLKEGQRYVLQGRTDAQGNNSGIGAQPNQILVVKEEVDKNTFVAVTPTTITTIVTPKVEAPQPPIEPTPQPITTPSPTPTPQPTITESATVTTVETATSTIVIDTPTATIEPTPTPTPTNETSADDVSSEYYLISWATFFEWLRVMFSTLFVINP